MDIIKKINTYYKLCTAAGKLLPSYEFSVSYGLIGEAIEKKLNIVLGELKNPKDKEHLKKQIDLLVNVKNVFGQQKTKEALGECLKILNLLKKTIPVFVKDQDLDIIINNISAVYYRN